MLENSEGNLITVYNHAENEMLYLKVGDNVTFAINSSYQDINRKLLTGKFALKANDGKWHRLGLSIKVIESKVIIKFVLQLLIKGRLCHLYD